MTPAQKENAAIVLENSCGIFIFALFTMICVVAEAAAVAVFAGVALWGAMRKWFPPLGKKIGAVAAGLAYFLTVIMALHSLGLIQPSDDVLLKILFVTIGAWYFFFLILISNRRKPKNSYD